MRGDLSWLADGFRCKRCVRTIKDADLAGDLVVDGKTYGCVKIFCYLGDTLMEMVEWILLLQLESEMDRWMKYRKLLPFLTSRIPPIEMKGRVYARCVRSSMTYGSETRPLLADIVLKFERAEMQMTRWMCDVSMIDRRTSE